MKWSALSDSMARADFAACYPNEPWPGYECPGRPATLTALATAGLGGGGWEEAETTGWWSSASKRERNAKNNERRHTREGSQ